MTNAYSKKRTDSASRVIRTSPQTLYQTFLNPDALVAWLPPNGMKGHICRFDPREGGTYRMALTYNGPDHSVPGKTSEHTDIVKGRFLELVPDERIVQVAEFEAEDPAFAGAMTITWTFAAVPSGTKVTILCENVPAGIRREDHDRGLRSTLENLAAFAE